MTIANVEETKDRKPRIRELTWENGLDYPSDAELIMLILGKGTRNMPIERMAEKVLEAVNDSPKEKLPEVLSRIEGIGRPKALAIAAAIELGSRRNRKLRSPIVTPADVIPFIKHLALENREHFVTVTVNGSHEIISVRVISVGTINRTLIHPREVFAEAIKEHASGIICCHNHPYGPCFPSKADCESTRVLQKAAEILGITFLDHIIINRDSYFSFEEHGMLNT